MLTASVYGAPPVFLWQPLVLTNGAELGTLQNQAGQVVTLDGKHIFLVTPWSSLEGQGQQRAEEQYDENCEKSEEDRKEQQEAEEERQKELEENGAYVSGDHTVAIKYEGEEEEEEEDYSQKTYEETTAENRVLKESDDYVQERDVSENQEKPQEDKTDSDTGSGEEEGTKEISTEDVYDEKTESPNESEIVKENQQVVQEMQNSVKLEVVKINLNH